MRSGADARILIVEDNEIDVHFIKLALKQGGFTSEPAVVDDGNPAIALLERAKEQPQQAVLPDLVILDLNLKQVDGPQVLAHIRQTEHLKHICVAILSSSPADVMHSRAAEADGYFTKPSDLDEFLRVGQKIRSCYADACQPG